MWKLDAGIAKRVAIMAGLGLAAMALSSCGTTVTCVGIKSCLTAYQLPADVASAEISVELDLVRSPGVEHQIFSIADNAEMRRAKTLAVVWRILYPSHGDVRVEAGKQIFVRAETIRPEGLEVLTCFNLISFTPQPGASYEMIQPVPRNGQCRLDIRDRSTGRPVPDLEMHDVSKALPWW